MSDLTRKAIQKLFEHISNGKTNLKIVEFVHAYFEFEGFDPARFLAALLEKEPNHDVLMTDATIICTWIAMRGTNISERNTARTSEAGRKLIKALVQKYDIAPNLGNRAKEVTMGRFSSVFAPQMAIILNQGIGRQVATIPNGLPPALAFPGGPSLIPKDATWDPLFDLWVQWSSEFTSVIQPIDRNRAIRDRAERFTDNAKKFGIIARNNGRLSDRQRLEFLVRNGMVYQERSGVVHVYTSIRRTEVSHSVDSELTRVGKEMGVSAESDWKTSTFFNVPVPEQEVIRHATRFVPEITPSTEDLDHILAQIAEYDKGKAKETLERVKGDEGGAP